MNATQVVSQNLETDLRFLLVSTAVVEPGDPVAPDSVFVKGDLVFQLSPLSKLLPSPSWAVMDDSDFVSVQSMEAVFDGLLQEGCKADVIIFYLWSDHLVRVVPVVRRAFLGACLVGVTSTPSLLERRFVLLQAGCSDYCHLIGQPEALILHELRELCARYKERRSLFLS